MTDRFTDEQLAEWLYDAQYDYEQDPAEYDYDFDAQPRPRGTFPKYYSDDYNSTLAALFSEILDSRQRIKALTAEGGSTA
jgi:hypothetical protein